MTQEVPLPLDPTPAPPPSNPLLMVVSGVLSFLLWLAVVGQFVLFVPMFEKMVGDFMIKMPSLTEWVVHDSRRVVLGITIAAVLVCIVLGRRSRWPWLFLLFLLPLAVNLLVGGSLLFTYLELLEGLGGGGKK